MKKRKFDIFLFMTIMIGIFSLLGIMGEIYLWLKFLPLNADAIQIIFFILTVIITCMSLGFMIFCVFTIGQNRERIDELEEKLKDKNDI